jgi:hypothetical protein
MNDSKEGGNLGMPSQSPIYFKLRYVKVPPLPPKLLNDECTETAGGAMILPIGYVLGGWFLLITSVIVEETIRALIALNGSNVLAGDHWWYYSIYVPILVLAILLLALGGFWCLIKIPWSRIWLKIGVAFFFTVAHVLLAGIVWAVLTFFMCIFWMFLGAYELI